MAIYSIDDLKSEDKVQNNPPQVPETPETTVTDEVPDYVIEQAMDVPWEVPPALSEYDSDNHSSSEVIGAHFRESNTAYLTKQAYDIGRLGNGELDPDFNLDESLKNEGITDTFGYFSDVKNQDQFNQALKYHYDHIEDMKILSDTPFARRLTLGLVAGIADPINYIPVARAIKWGTTAVRAGIEGAILGGIGSGIAYKVHKDISPQEVAIDVVASGLCSAMLAHVTKEETRQALKAGFKDVLTGKVEVKPNSDLVYELMGLKATAQQKARNFFIYPTPQLQAQNSEDPLIKSLSPYISYDRQFTTTGNEYSVQEGINAFNVKFNKWYNTITKNKQEYIKKQKEAGISPELAQEEWEREAKRTIVTWLDNPIGETPDHSDITGLLKIGKDCLAEAKKYDVLSEDFATHEITTTNDIVLTPEIAHMSDAEFNEVVRQVQDTKNFVSHINRLKFDYRDLMSDIERASQQISGIIDGKSILDKLHNLAQKYETDKLIKQKVKRIQNDISNVSKSDSRTAKQIEQLDESHTKKINLFIDKFDNLLMRISKDMGMSDGEIDINKLKSVDIEKIENEVLKLKKDFISKDNEYAAEIVDDFLKRINNADEIVYRQKTKEEIIHLLEVMEGSKDKSKELLRYENYISRLRQRLKSEKIKQEIDSSKKFLFELEDNIKYSEKVMDNLKKTHKQFATDILNNVKNVLSKISNDINNKSIDFEKVKKEFLPIKEKAKNTNLSDFSDLIDNFLSNLDPQGKYQKILTAQKEQMLTKYLAKLDQAIEKNIKPEFLKDKTVQERVYQRLNIDNVLKKLDKIAASLVKKNDSNININNISNHFIGLKEKINSFFDKVNPEEIQTTVGNFLKKLLEERGFRTTTANNYFPRRYNSKKMRENATQLHFLIKRSIELNTPKISDDEASSLAYQMLADMTGEGVNGKFSNIRGSSDISFAQRTVAISDNILFDYLDLDSCINSYYRSLKRITAATQLNRVAKGAGFESWSSLEKKYADQLNTNSGRKIVEGDISPGEMINAQNNHKLLTDIRLLYMGDFTKTDTFANNRLLKALNETTYLQYAWQLGSTLIRSLNDLAIDVFHFGFLRTGKNLATILAKDRQARRDVLFNMSFLERMKDSSIRFFLDSEEETLSSFKRATKKIADWENKVSLQHYWDKALRKTALEELYSDTIKVAYKVGDNIDITKLDKREKNFFEAIGLTEDSVKEIRSAFDKYGENYLGIAYVDPVHLSAQTSEHLSTVLRTLTDQIVLTPSATNVPIWTRSELGRMIHHYVNYGFMAYENVFLPMVRGKYGISRMAQGIAASLALTALSEWIYNYSNYKETDWLSGDTWKNIVTGSHLLNPIIWAADKGLDVLDKGAYAIAERFVPAAAWLANTTSVVRNLVTGDVDRIRWNKFPGFNLWEAKILKRLSEDL